MTLALRPALASAMVALSASACANVTPSSTSSDGGSSTVALACVSTADCIEALPTTTPIACATASCSANTCVFKAKDEDGDGHAAAFCKALNGLTVQVGDDCDDHDPNLYPGHPEACDTLSDGTAASSGLCASGKISCLAGGATSACIGTVACRDQTCVDGSCVGACAPGQARCKEAGVEACGADGSFGAATPCSSGTCISVDGGVSCQGMCATGAVGCSGNQPVTCVDGSWSNVGAPCSGGVCNEGVCVACTPGSLRCGGTQPEACSADGSTWVDAGSDCASASQSCLRGACVACDPGAIGCDGQQPRSCNASGAWIDVGSACVDQVCVDGACQGTCGPAGPTCSGADLVTCDATGEPTSSIPCPADCCAAECVDATSDVNHCGACDVSCDAGPSPACGVGLCNYTLASGSDAGGDFWCGPVVDATSVYWIMPGSPSSLMKMPLGGGAATTLASAPNADFSLAVDATSAYWGVSFYDLGVSSTDFVLKVPIEGGTPTTLVSGQNLLSPVVVDATSLYWSSDEALLNVPLGGGTPMTVAPGVSTRTLLVDAASLYFTTCFDEDQDCAVEKVPLGGGAVTTLASGQVDLFGFAIDATRVYWTAGGAVMSLPLGGGTPTTLAPLPFGALGFTIDATSVYWTTETDPGSVMKAPLGGGTPTTLAAGLVYPGSLVVGPADVYWVGGGLVSFSLMEAAK